MSRSIGHMLKGGAALACVLTATACASAPRDTAQTTTLTVFAASSLMEPLTQISSDFEHDHPGVSVRVQFGGSSGLATQLVHGARADVFASANEEQMQSVVAAGVASAPVDFASNTLTIAVPASNPAKVTGLHHLADGSIDLVTCAVPVPCGVAAHSIARASGVSLRPVSEELSATEVVAKVSIGQADAGLVYVSDIVTSEGALESIALPHAENFRTTYSIARLRDAREAALADLFVDAVLADAGQTTLGAAGFGAP